MADQRALVRQPDRSLALAPLVSSFQAKAWLEVGMIGPIYFYIAGYVKGDWLLMRISKTASRLHAPLMARAELRGTW